MLWFTLLSVALAEPEAVAVDDGAFQAEGEAHRIAVRTLVVPEGAAKQADARVCRVRFTATEPGPMAPMLATCPEELQGPTEAAMDRWVVQLESEPPEDGIEPRSYELEVWVRFGLDDRETAELFVRGDWRQQLKTPAGVAATTLSPAELPKPVFPAEQLEAGSLGADCTVELDVSHRGYLLGEPVVRGCEAPFADAVVAASERWKFKTPRLGQEPTAMASTLGVVFEVVPGSAPGELDTSVSVVVPAAEERVMVRGNRPRRMSGIPRNADPLLVLDHDPYAAVEIMGWSWPEVAVAEEQRCHLLVQVDSRRRIVVWPEACPEEVREASVAAVRSWSLRPGEVEPGERYGRFRAALVFAPDAEPHMVVPEDDVQVVGEEVQPRVHTFREAVTKSRVPPKIPKGLAAAEECVLTVEVGTNGKPAAIESVDCSESAFAEAKKAVKQWRWDPAKENGEPRAWSTTVKLTFSAPK